MTAIAFSLCLPACQPPDQYDSADKRTETYSNQSIPFTTRHPAKVHGELHSDSWSSEFDSLIEAAIIDSTIPGAVLSIYSGGERIFEKAYGWSQLYRLEQGKMVIDRIVMTPETRFDLASLTKVFATTLSVMGLVDEGKMILDDPLHTYLPSFRGVNKDSITLRHLLTHTSGLYPWKPIYYHADNKTESYEYIRSLPLAYPVGKERHYSDLGFMLLGYAVESVIKTNLHEYLRTNWYDPLSLSDTGFKHNPDNSPVAATSHGNPFERKMVADDDFGYRCDEDPETFTRWRTYTLRGEVNDGNAHYAHDGVAGHAGLFSTADDLQQILQVLLNLGKSHNKAMIESSTVLPFLTQDTFGHGLGWAMSPPALPADSLPIGGFGHTGFTGTYVVAVPQTKASVVLLTNRQNLGVDKSGRYPNLTGFRRQITSIFLRSLSPDLQRH